MIKRAREAAYRERFRLGAYAVTFVLSTEWQRILIDQGHLNEADLDIENWRERKRRLEIALARFMYANRPDCVDASTTASSARDKFDSKIKDGS